MTRQKKEKATKLNEEKVDEILEEKVESEAGQMAEEKEVKTDKKSCSKSDKKSEKMAAQVADLEQQLEETKAQLAESKDKFLRLFSEFDNYKKRTARERVDLISTANSDLILKLLQVVDDIDRADQSMKEATDVEAVKMGSDLIFDKLKSILKSSGLEEIESTGKEFDTDEHEAIAQFPATTEEQKNIVIDTTKKGYKLNGKIIRVAQVVVGC